MLTIIDACLQSNTSHVDIAVLQISKACKWDTLDHIIRKAFKVHYTRISLKKLNSSVQCMHVSAGVVSLMCCCLIQFFLYFLSIYNVVIMANSWQQNKILRWLWKLQEYVKRLDGSTNLGLTSDSISSYCIGDVIRSKRMSVYYW